MEIACLHSVQKSQKKEIFDFKQDKATDSNDIIYGKQLDTSLWKTLIGLTINALVVDIMYAIQK